MQGLNENIFKIFYFSFFACLSRRTNPFNAYLPPSFPQNMVKNEPVSIFCLFFFYFPRKSVRFDENDEGRYALK